MNLEEYRKYRKFTYERLAAFLGFSVNKTYRICCNGHVPKVSEGLEIIKRCDGYVGLTDLEGISCDDHLKLHAQIKPEGNTSDS